METLNLCAVSLFSGGIINLYRVYTEGENEVNERVRKKINEGDSL